MPKITIRESFPSLFLLINSIVWFSLSWFVIQNYVSNTSYDNILLVSSSYFGALLLSAVVGATLLRKKLLGKIGLLSWVSFGVVICLLSAVLVH